MPYEINPAEPIADEVRRIAAELVEDALADSKRPDSDPQKAVHEVRKDCKRVRALLRLIRPAVPGLYKEENARFRNAAATLSELRDAEASIGGYDALMDRFAAEIDRQTLAPLRDGLEAHRHQLSKASGGVHERLADFHQAMILARERLQDWDLPAASGHHAGFEQLGPGLTKTYRRGRKALTNAYAEGSAEAFHEWRKRAKYLRYHLRLLRPAWPRLLRRTYKEVKTLGDLLGDDHDLAVLDATLSHTIDAEAYQEHLALVRNLMAERSQELRHDARLLGMRVYAEKPKALRRRLRGYWEATIRASSS